MFGLERIFRLLWLIVLVTEVTFAVASALLLPGGFPLSHPRFWSNSIAPPCLGLFGLVSLWALHGQPLGTLRGLLRPRIWFWTAMIATAAALFPITLRGYGILAAIVVLVAGIVVARVCAGSPDTRNVRALDLPTACLSVLIGIALAWTQKPPPSGTNPFSQHDPGAYEPYATRDEQASGVIQLNARTSIQASDASLMVRMPPLTLSVQPLLTFLSRSPDGAPTVLVPADLREPPRVQLRSASRLSENSAKLRYEVFSQGHASLRLEARAAGALDVESLCELREPQYSHLNSFSDFEIRGQTRLSLAFSPCPASPVEVLPFDYPFGRPSRFAFVDAGRNFRVVEASNSEKGPFHDLARGRLEPDQPLTITLLDAGKAVGRITLDDWSAQADTTLSPTAGWGVPVNAIEFSLSGDSPGAPASIFITLAATSVGRGWDCVAHSAGVYRNRMHLTPLGPESEHSPPKQKPEPSPSS